MGIEEKLQTRVKKISLMCIAVNLFLILTSIDQAFNKYRLEYLIMIGSTFLMEVFVDLPINILLFFAVNSNRKKLILPWLLFNGLRTIVTVIMVSLLVIFVIVGVDQFHASQKFYDIVPSSENSLQIANTEKRYNS